jgi:hypothetical protein
MEGGALPFPALRWEAWVALGGGGCWVDPDLNVDQDLDVEVDVDVDADVSGWRCPAQRWAGRPGSLSEGFARWVWIWMWKWLR